MGELNTCLQAVRLEGTNRAAVKKVNMKRGKLKKVKKKGRERSASPARINEKGENQKEKERSDQTDTHNIKNTR